MESGNTKDETSNDERDSQLSNILYISGLVGVSNDDKSRERIASQLENMYIIRSTLVVLKKDTSIETRDLQSANICDISVTF